MYIDDLNCLEPAKREQLSTRAKTREKVDVDARGQLVTNEFGDSHLSSWKPQRLRDQNLGYLGSTPMLAEETTVLREEENAYVTDFHS